MNIRTGLVALFWIGILSVVCAQAQEKWQFIHQYENIDLYSATEETQGFIPFKAVAQLSVPYQKIVMALVDAEQKSLWAPKLKSTTVHSESAPNAFEFSEYYTTPWPFLDREFLLLGQVEYTQDRVVFTATNSPQRELARDDHVLVDIKNLKFDIIPLDTETTRVEFTFSGNMGGWIPDFVQTIIQKKWPVRFIQALDKRIRNQSRLTTLRYENIRKHAISIPGG